MVFHPIVFPVLDPALQNRLKQILETQLADDVKGWLMQSDGDYHRPSSTGFSTPIPRKCSMSCWLMAKQALGRFFEKFS